MQTQAERIAGMRDEIVALGGSTVTFEEVPPHIEEALLRRALNKPGGYGSLLEEEAE